MPLVQLEDNEAEGPWECWDECICFIFKDAQKYFNYEDKQLGEKGRFWEVEIEGKLPDVGKEY